MAGGDITLAALSGFLASLELGANGRALIIDRRRPAGRLSGPRGGGRRQTDGEFRPAQIDAIGDPVLAEAYDRIRVAGDGRSIVEIDDQRYIVAAAALAEPAARDWRLLLVVPEDDLVGFRRRQQPQDAASVQRRRRPGDLSCGAARVSGTGRRSQRAGARPAGTALAAQTAAFDELASTAALFEPGDREALRRLTETVGRTLAARRVSLWQIDDRQGEIICLDCYDQECNGHTTGAAIRRVECPELFEALASGDEIAVEDAAQDARTAGLARIYLSAARLAARCSRSRSAGAPMWSAASGSRTPARPGRRGVEAQSFARTSRICSGRASRRQASRRRPPGRGGRRRRRPCDARSTTAAKLTAPATALRTASISDERHRALLRTIRPTAAWATIGCSARCIRTPPCSCSASSTISPSPRASMPSSRSASSSRSSRPCRRSRERLERALRQDHDQRDRGGRGLRWRGAPGGRRRLPRWRWRSRTSARAASPSSAGGSTIRSASIPAR